MPPPPASPDTPLPSPPEILLVDPDAARRRDLLEAFERRGFRVLPASDREVACALLRTRAVAAVVADRHLSVSAHALRRAARAGPRRSPTPVIVFGPDGE